MKKTKHTVALALAAMLACQPLSVYAATFADMNQAPWAGAEASINKAASRGKPGSGCWGNQKRQNLFSPQRFCFSVRILPAGV